MGTSKKIAGYILRGLAKVFRVISTSTAKLADLAQNMGDKL